VGQALDECSRHEARKAQACEKLEDIVQEVWEVGYEMAPTGSVDCSLEERGAGSGISVDCSKESDSQPHTAVLHCEISGREQSYCGLVRLVLVHVHLDAGLYRRGPAEGHGAGLGLPQIATRSVEGAEGVVEVEVEESSNHSW
jgi:hypothetical protein